VPPFPSLRRKADFDALMAGGTGRSTPILVLRTMRTDGATTRIGFSTPKALGGAVQRNRVRRRLRALVRERYGELGTGWDLLVIARPAAAQASFADLREAFGALLGRSEIGR
jgi:ribonuclease P protein component